MVVPKKKGKREFDVDESVESDHISTYVTMETDDDFTFEFGSDYTADARMQKCLDSCLFDDFGDLFDDDDF